MIQKCKIYLALIYRIYYILLNQHQLITFIDKYS